MLFKVLQTFFCCTFLLWPQFSQSDERLNDHTIVVGFEKDSPPYVFINDQGEADGFSINLAKMIAEQQGVHMTLREAPWSESRKALEQGQIDAVTTMGYSDHRAQSVDFSVPYLKDEFALFRHNGSPSIGTIADLQGKRVLVLRSGIEHDFLQQTAPEALPVLVDDWPEVLSQLADGKADYAMITKMAGLYFIKQLKLSELKQVPLADVDMTMWYAFAVKKNDRQLLEQLNEGMTHIQGSGQFDRLYQQWFGELEPKTFASSEVLKTIAWILVIGAGLFGLILVWSLLLKRQVKLRTLSLEAEIQERKQVESALRFSETRCRTMFMNAGIGISVVDQSGRFVSANPALCKMLGYNEKEIKTLSVHDITHTDDIPLMKSGFEGLFNYSDEYYHSEQRFLDKDNEVVWGDSTGTVFRTGDDAAPLCVYIIKDTSDKKHSEHVRDQLQQQLQQASKMEAIGQLTGGFAHDFNNILTGILGYADLAQVMCVEDEESKLAVYLQNITQAGERARDLINQMMTFSRHEVGTPILLEPIVMVKEVEALLRASLPATINISTKASLDTAPVYMDPVKFHRMLINLCINARDAMQNRGEIHIAVNEVTAQDIACTSCGQALTGSWVEVTVSDSGSGIKPELLAQVFDPFFTTKGVNKGTGMGLSVVHGLMHESQGHVVIDTRLGQGTTFRLLFPVGKESIGDTPTIDSKKHSMASNKSGNIMVVDDEPHITSILYEYLSHQGYEVDVYSSGNQAMLGFKERPMHYDLVITDQTMPDTTGIDLAKQLYSISPELPIILCTGFIESLEEQNLKNIGIRSLLKKPISMSDLVSEVETHLSAPCPN